MSSTITSSSSSSPPNPSTSPFHSFSASVPTQWPATRHSLPSSTISSSHDPYSPLPLSKDIPLSIRPPSNSTHALSELTRRHLSKLSKLSPRESDVDSVLSEPVSYSKSSYVAADMWLVSKEVEHAERVVARREKERERFRTRNDHTDDVFSKVQEAQDVSSKLVRLFFAGGARDVPTGGGTPNEAGYRKYAGDRAVIGDRDANGDNFDWGKGAIRGEDGWGGYQKKRRFEKVRRLRWWMRRLALKVRGEGE